VSAEVPHRFVSKTCPRFRHPAFTAHCSPLTTHHSPPTTHPSLPETPNRVETHVSHRKQKVAYRFTRDGSRGDPAIPSLKPRASSLKPRASSLKPQASSLKPQASSHHNLLGTRERLEIRASHRKQTLGAVLIGTDPVPRCASNFDLAFAARPCSLTTASQAGSGQKRQDAGLKAPALHSNLVQGTRTGRPGPQGRPGATLKPGSRRERETERLTGWLAGHTFRLDVRHMPMAFDANRQSVTRRYGQGVRRAWLGDRERVNEM
jgi:hypothetical protein